MKDYIAILCAGGHISCFNSALFGIAKEAKDFDLGVIGFKDGFKGANSGKYYIFDEEYAKNYAEIGGSFIGSSREKSDANAVKSVLEKLAKEDINVKGIIGMGGDDHLGQLNRLFEEEGIPVVGWPKTMDNDLSKTFFSLGYASAAENAAAAIRRSWHGAWTNNRVHIVTMFGRDTDWVVAAAGAWGAADLVIGGEVKEYDIKEVYEKIQTEVEKNKKEYGRKFTVLAVGEGAKINGIESHCDENQKDKHGHSKLVPEKLALEIQTGLKKIDEKMATSIDTLTYNELRNCSPAKWDRWLAAAAGAKCVDEIWNGNSGNCVVIDFNVGGLLKTEPLKEVAKKRYLSVEEFVDYKNMKVEPSFIRYYSSLFGKPKTKEEILFKKLEEKSV